VRLFRKAGSAPAPKIRFPDWDALATRLRTELRELVDDPRRFVVLSIAGSDDFVQWHGNEPGVGYAEASSGYYGASVNSPEQAARLAHLGWTPPGKDALGTKVRNWSRYWSAGEEPDLVDSTIRTLREVFRAGIADVGMDAGR
jgi:hypothetical protein